MAENDQESQGLEPSPQPAATGDSQSLLLRLAERTVLQAEALAQEITERARQDSEAEGAKLLAEYTDQAKAEAQKTIDIAQRRTETILNEANAKSIADSEKMMTKAHSDSAEMLSKARTESEQLLSGAQSESDKMLSKARYDSDESLSKAQTEGKEILGNAQIEVKSVLAKAQQEASGIINVSQARADSTESNARLNAEFIIRQTTQNVADGIRSAVLETCNNLLPALDNLGKETPAAPFAGQVDRAAATETVSIDNADSSETEKVSSTAETDTGAPSSGTPSGRRTRSSARTPGSA